MKLVVPFALLLLMTGCAGTLEAPTASPSPKKAVRPGIASHRRFRTSDGYAVQKAVVPDGNADHPTPTLDGYADPDTDPDGYANSNTDSDGYANPDTDT